MSKKQNKTLKWGVGYVIHPQGDTQTFPEKSNPEKHKPEKEHGKESKAGTDGLHQQPDAQESIVSVPNADLDAHFITGSF